jgi:tRNA-dihydrouridine synthase
MEDVYRRVSETGVDGALLGRAAEGNPWIFRAKDQVKEALRSGSPLSIEQDPIGLDERFRVLLEHSWIFESHWGNPTFVGMRKHLAWYCKGFRGAAELRSKMVRTNSASDVVECVRSFSRAFASNISVVEHPCAADLQI